MWQSSQSSGESPSNMAASSFDQYYQQHQEQQHPLVASIPAPSIPPSKGWRTHGTNIQESLEEKRSGASIRIGNDGHGNNGTFCPEFVVRVISAEKRHDLSGSDYTAYVIRIVHTPPASQLTQQPQHHGTGIGLGSGTTTATNGIIIPTTTRTEQTSRVILTERRYSEFSALHTLLQKHQVLSSSNSSGTEAVSFPAKHWAGRMGNWTPSVRWAPEQHESLVSYRTIQLDIWLVHVVELYNWHCATGGTATATMKPTSKPLPPEAVQAIYDFLTVSSSERPPCERTNVVDKGDGSSSVWKWNNPIAFTLGSSIRQAIHTVNYMMMRDGSTVGTTASSSISARNSNISSSSKSKTQTMNESDRSIPLDLLQAAKGLCFLTVVKAGMVVSGRVGTGFVVARLEDDCLGKSMWSAPCALGTVGMGWGAQVGGDVTHYVVVLTTHEAVRDFVASNSNASVQLGAELGVAVGPLGRSANSQLQTGDWTLHPAYAYAHSQGLFVGMSLEGSFVKVRHDVNAKFYGKSVDPEELLQQTAPKAAEALQGALDLALQQVIPKGGFRPSQLFSPPAVKSAREAEAAAGANQHGVAYLENNKQHFEPTFSFDDHSTGSDFDSSLTPSIIITPSGDHA